MISFPPSPVSQNSTSKKQPKLRSTCDACKDAKTRCNREVPSCYRCRNQKLKCVYNLSRRMGRPRRLKTSVESQKQGREGVEGSNNSEDGNMRNEGNMAEAALRQIDTNIEQSEEQGTPPLTVNYTNHHSASVVSSSSNGKPQNTNAISSLLDTFNSPEDYDISQLQPLVDLTNFDNLTDFEFLNGPTLTMASGPPSPIMSRSSQNTKTQTESIFEHPSTREESNCTGAMTPLHKAHSISNSGANTLTHGDPMSIDWLNGKPISSLESTSHRIQSDGNEAQHCCRHTSSKPLTDNSDGSRAAALGQSASCRCFETVLQKLSDLDESQSEIFSSTIDVALILEKGLHMHTAQVLQCGTCATKRPTLLLLLAIVIDNVVCMLENASSFSNKSQMDNTTFLVRPSRRSFRATTAEAKGDRAADNSMDKPSLLVGGHEIFSEEKNKFLKQLLQERLSSLSSTLRQLMQYMQRSPQNSNSKHGTIMVFETYKRLQSIIGRVELWDG